MQYVVNEERLTAIADAIRAKTGNTEVLTLDQMPTEIEAIESEIPEGYIVPSGSVTITENGNYDVTEKASAIVAVPERKITLQNKSITANGTYTADTGYDGLGQVIVDVSSGGGGEDQLSAWIDGTTTVLDSNVTTVSKEVCRGRTTLTAVNLPNAQTIGANAFYGCTGLTSVNAPNVQTLETYAFYGCSKLTSVKFPLVASLKVSTFNGCKALVKADFTPVSGIAANTFNGTTALKALILRKTNAVTNLGNTSAFTSSGIANGTGYIYVPRALVDTYKAASNWSTYASQFRALEDYTVDGTTTGELDESKI